MVMRQRLLIVACAAVLMAFGWAVFGPARHATAAAAGFVAPLPAPLTVLRGFEPPAQPWLPGNRGVDLAAATGQPVVAAADGLVVYAGLLAGRGVVSISHGAVRTTYEPVDPIVSRGETVRRGELIGRVSATADGCGPPGSCLHWGAIRGDAYVDPLSLIAPPEVRLLPIWTDGLPTSAPTDQQPASAGSPDAAANAPQLAGPTRHQPDDAIATAAIGAGAALAGTAALGRARRARLADPQAASARKLPAL
ncbi:MAG TPA: M23 family metallopeptidase [Acidothermaceae bacterium]|jgi:hypothetical protein